MSQMSHSVPRDQTRTPGVPYQQSTRPVITPDMASASHPSLDLPGHNAGDHGHSSTSNISPRSCNQLDAASRQSDLQAQPDSDCESINSSVEPWLLLPPTDFSSLGSWIYLHFQDYFRLSEPALHKFIHGVLSIHSLDDIRVWMVRFEHPSAVCDFVPRQLYMTYLPQFVEMCILAQFILSSMDSHLAVPWSLDEYLSLRATHHSYVQAKFFNVIAPAYASTSPNLGTSSASQSSRSSRPRRSRRGSRTSSPYHSSRPRMVWNTPTYAYHAKGGETRHVPKKDSPWQSRSVSSNHRKEPSWQSRSVSSKHSKNSQRSEFSSYSFLDDGYVDPPDLWQDKPKSSRISQRSSRSEFYRLSSRPKPRSKINDKITWDGHLSTFKSFSKVVDGHLLQVNAGYLINPAFMTNYSSHGMDYVKTDEFWTTFEVPVPQVAADAKYLYGILCATNRSRDDKILLRHANDQDGIAAWIEFKSDYGNNGSKELKISEIEASIKQEYNPAKEGMATYLDHFTAALQELETLVPDQYPDSMKKRLLLSNVGGIPELLPFVQTCRDDARYGFKETTSYFRRNAAWMDKATQRAKPPKPGTMLRLETQADNEVSTTPQELNLDETISLINKLSTETSVFTTLQSMQSRTFRESLRIPDGIWKMLEPELQKKLAEIREEVKKRRAERMAKDSKPSGSSSGIPAQYPTMVAKKNAEVVANLCNQLADMAVDHDYDTDEDDIELFKFMAATTSSDEYDMKDSLEIRAHFEYATLFDDPKKVYAISDGGADSCVLGKHAHVIHETGRYATLLGYDPANTKSGRIPIVSAYVKAMAHNGIPILLKIHEAPYNEKCPVTLLSEYQMREHGVLIDSVARKHKATATQNGTQRLTLSDYVHIPFEDRGAIMGFEILPITDDDIVDGEPMYDVFEVTGVAPWKPRRFQDELKAQTVAKVDNEDISGPDLYYFDPLDDLDANQMPDAQPRLDVAFLQQSDDAMGQMLDNMTYEDITGMTTYKPECDGYPPLSNIPMEDELGDDVISQLMFTPTLPSDHTFVMATKSWHRIVYEDVDPQRVQPYLGWRSLDVVKKTLQATTQMARMIIRYPLRRHFKARAPFLNVNRLDEVVSTDPIFANCRSIHHGYHGCQVFYGLTSHQIDVYGFKSKGEFPRIYRDFIREQGAPSTLRRDNAKEEQSNDVLGIQRELYVKDQFSEAYNPQQNPVESNAIRWLKQASHKLMDRVGCPNSAWYFAVKYLAAIHRICYDKVIRMTPHQKRAGSTPDISAYLQFCFWDRVLYLDHEEKWPSSNERAGYWVGVAENTGDALTYWILDDQTKRLLARSVVRPFHQNHRVHWDPAFATKPLRRTAQHGGDVKPTRAEIDNAMSTSMDKYDEDEPEPEPRYFDCHQESHDKAKRKSKPVKPILLNKDPLDEGFDVETPVVPMIDPDTYNGDALLRYSNEPLEQHPDIDVIKTTGKLPLSKISYPTPYKPPEINNTVDTVKERNKDSNKAKKENDAGIETKRGEPLIAKLESRKAEPETKLETDNDKGISGMPKLRRSERLRKANYTTVWRPGRFSKWLACTSAILGVLFLPTTIVAEPANALIDSGNPHLFPDSAYAKPLSTSKKLEGLRAYHAHLDQMNSIYGSDPEDELWNIAKIEKTLNREQPNGTVKVMAKIHYMDGSKAWLNLDTIRLHDPLVAIRYAVTNKKMSHKGWEWVEDYMKGDDEFAQIARAFRVSRDQAKKYKFGVEVPRSPKHALQIDQENKNTGWKDAMSLELNQLKDYQTFKEIPDGQPIPKGYKRVPYHLVFDVKFDGRLKARLVANGNRTPQVDPEDVFSGVVSMEAVRLGFILAEMNDLLVCAGDVGNAFLYGKTKEKVFIVAGPEFGPELAGKRLIIDKSLYGLKTSAARFHEHLSVKLRKMGFFPSRADPDLWMRKHGNHYEYIARFVDDVIAFSKNPMVIMEELKKTYIMKGVGKPQYYLGGDVVDTSEDWHKEEIKVAFSAETYIQNCLPKLAKLMNLETFKKANTPFDSNYHPELDDSPFVSPEQISVYRSLIGSANWMITLGRFDIAFAISVMSRYSMAPREGHLEAMKRIFGYLRVYRTGRLLIDIHDAPIRSKAIISKGHNWCEFYPDAEEDIPRDMPRPLGMEGKLTVYVDADHARDQLTRRSMTGIILLLNNTPLVWISKRQKTVETSTYGSELVAARIAIDLIIEMRYKMRMLGVVLEEESMLVGDNMAVILNTTLPSSSLKKKHQACNYHRIREAIAGGYVTFGHIDSEDNMADICTKPLANPAFHNLTGRYLFRKSKAAGQQVSEKEKKEDTERS